MIQKLWPIPERLKPARTVAISASVAALILALLPAAFGATDYDATIAVLTATLIAIVWYTFFTFWAATREDPTFLRVSLSRDALHLLPLIENPTRRTVTVRPIMRIWIGGQELPQSEFYRGEDPATLPPEGSLQGSVDIRPHFDVTFDEHGDASPEHNDALVMLSATWEDDLGESGSTLPRYYRVPFHGGAITSVVAKENLAALFPESAFSGGSSPQLPQVSETRKSGFVRTTDEEIEVHRLREPVTNLRLVRPRSYEAETLSGIREVTHVGEGWVTLTVATGDVRPPLTGWIGDGSTVEADFRMNLDDSDSAVPCSLLVDDTKDLTSGWHQRSLRLRAVPHGIPVTALLSALQEAL